jgi:hypothetical protein
MPPSRNLDIREVLKASFIFLFLKMLYALKCTYLNAALKIVFFFKNKIKLENKIIIFLYLRVPPAASLNFTHFPKCRKNL